MTAAASAIRRRPVRQPRSIVERIRGEHALRIIAGCFHACFLCDRFIARGGGCPGVPGDDADGALPICHSRWREHRRRVEARGQLFDRFCARCGLLDRTGQNGCAGLAVRYDHTPLVEELMSCFADGTDTGMPGFSSLPGLSEGAAARSGGSPPARPAAVPGPTGPPPPQNRGGQCGDRQLRERARARAGDGVPPSPERRPPGCRECPGIAPSSGCRADGERSCE